MIKVLTDMDFGETLAAKNSKIEASVVIEPVKHEIRFGRIQEIQTSIIKNETNFANPPEVITAVKVSGIWYGLGFDKKIPDIPCETFAPRVSRNDHFISIFPESNADRVTLSFVLRKNERYHLPETGDRIEVTIIKKPSGWVMDKIPETYSQGVVSFDTPKNAQIPWGKDAAGNYLVPAIPVNPVTGEIRIAKFLSSSPIQVTTENQENGCEIRVDAVENFSAGNPPQSGVIHVRESPGYVEFEMFGEGHANPRNIYFEYSLDDGLTWIDGGYWHKTNGQKQRGLYADPIPEFGYAMANYTSVYFKSNKFNPIQPGNNYVKDPNSRDVNKLVTLEEYFDGVTNPSSAVKHGLISFETAKWAGRTVRFYNVNYDGPDLLLIEHKIR